MNNKSTEINDLCILAINIFAQATRSVMCISFEYAYTLIDQLFCDKFAATVFECIAHMNGNKWSDELCGMNSNDLAS